MGTIGSVVLVVLIVIIVFLSLGYTPIFSALVGIASCVFCEKEA